MQFHLTLKVGDSIYHLRGPGGHMFIVDVSMCRAVHTYFSLGLDLRRGIKGHTCPASRRKLAESQQKFFCVIHHHYWKVSTHTINTGKLACALQQEGGLITKYCQPQYQLHRNASTINEYKLKLKCNTQNFI